MYTARSQFCLPLFLLVILFTAGSYDDAAAQSGGGIDPRHLSAVMNWRNIGPARGGRVLAVSGSVTDKDVFYFGATGGGVWKTVDGGKSWKPVSDSFETSSIGDVDVAGTDDNIVYVGTGEACLRGNISYGDGVYKSTDGGKSWENVGLRESRHIGRVLIHPENPDIVFVAALGHVYASTDGDRGDRGVYKTTDGGKTWKNVLPGVNNQTGAVDITINRTNPDILFASLYETFRTPYSLSSGGAGSGLYRSTDGGETWEHLTGGGLPGGILGKIGVSISPANPDRVYAMIEARDGGLYRSDDGGETWKLINNESDKRQRAWYYTHVTADPLDEDIVYVLNTRLQKSTDGGESFERITVPHGDVHALWIDPNDSQRMINGNDGGGNVSFDGGETWSTLNYPTAQFYHVFVDDDYPYNVYGAQQDNSTIKIPGTSTPDDRTWYPVGGGESGHVVPDPRNSNIVYAGSYGGLLTRYDHTTRTIRNIQPWPDNPMGWAAGDLKYRFQWTAPIMISRHDPRKLYHAANVLFRSFDEGETWEQISPDLTRNDKSRLGPSGGPITHDNTSVEYYCTIFALTESPLKEGVIWAGTDDGLVHISTDDGNTWQNVTPAPMPEWSLVSSIEASHYSVGTAYVAADRHEMDDFGAYAYKTEDFGQTWKEIGSGFPPGVFLRVIREDPEVPGILYAGTETGVYYSLDDGGSWHSLRLNMPVVPVHDLALKRNDLIAGTHGRSFWILDDLTVIHQLRDRDVRGTVLLKPRDTIRWAQTSRGSHGPENKVTFHYYLEKPPHGEITLEIRDERGGLVRSFSNIPEKKEETEETGEENEEETRSEVLPDTLGWNTFDWDMRYPGARTVPKHPMWAANTSGPRAVPGRYGARLTVDGTTRSTNCEILIDPRMGSSVMELRQQFDFLITIRDKVSLAHDTVNQLREIRENLGRLKLDAESAHAGRSFLRKIDTVADRLNTIEAQILQVKSKSRQDPLNFPIRVNNKLAALAGAVSNSYYAPTQQEYDVFDMLSTELDGYVARYQDVLTSELTELNAQALKLKLAPVAIKKPEKHMN